MKAAKKSTQEPAQGQARKQEKLCRDRARAARKANAEKQKRYRQSMKAQGYTAKLIWEKPLEPGWIRTAVPVIHESSLNIASKDQVMKEILENMTGTFIMDCEKKGILKKVWKPVYEDVMSLLKPLGMS